MYDVGFTQKYKKMSLARSALQTTSRLPIRGSFLRPNRLQTIANTQTRSGDHHNAQEPGDVLNIFFV